VPVFTRIILAAQRAGVHRFLVLSGPETSKLQALLAGTKRVKAEVLWVHASPPSDDGSFLKRFKDHPTPWFLLAGGTIFAPAILEKLLGALEGKAEVLVPACRPSEGLRGIALIPPALANRLAEAISRGATSWEDLIPIVGEQGIRPLDLSGEHLYVLDTSSIPRWEAEVSLYRTLGKPTDNLVIRETRKIAAFMLKGIVETAITPNQLTLLGFFLGMGAVILFWQARYVPVLLGGCLLVLSFVVDLADGMLARLKFLESQGGGWLDFVLDNVVHVGIFVSLIKIALLHSPTGPVLPFGILLIGGNLLSAATFALYMASRPGKRTTSGKMKKMDQRLEGIVESIRHRDFSLLVLLLAALDKLHWFFWAAAIGTNLFWPLVLYTLLRRRRRDEAR